MGRMFRGRRARTWELTDVRVIIYALKLPQVGISRDSNDINGFTLSDIAVVPHHSRELLCEMALSFLYSQVIRSLLLGLSCLLE